MSPQDSSAREKDLKALLQQLNAQSVRSARDEAIRYRTVTELTARQLATDLTHLEERVAGLESVKERFLMFLASAGAASAAGVAWVKDFFSS